MQEIGFGLDSQTAVDGAPVEMNMSTHTTGDMMECRTTRIQTLCVVIVILMSGTSWGLEFTLEGSLTSYTKFPPWEASENGSLKLQFRGLFPNGLLLYMDDGGRYDFFEVKLVEGVARLRLNLGGGTYVITLGQGLDDGEWHSMELHRASTETTFTLDSISETHHCSNADCQFGNASRNSDVFVGGLPIEYGARLSMLALPSVMFEPRFKGSVRNLVYTDFGGSSEYVQMIDSRGLRATDRSECDESNPCHHDGICVNTDSGTLCDCSHTDYIGKQCDTGTKSLLLFQVESSLLFLPPMFYILKCLLHLNILPSRCVSKCLPVDVKLILFCIPPKKIIFSIKFQVQQFLALVVPYPY